MNGSQENQMLEFVPNVIAPIGKGRRGREIKDTHRCCICKQNKARSEFRKYQYKRGILLFSKLSSRCQSCLPEYNRSRKRNKPICRHPYPEKNKARDMVKVKIRQGIIVPQPCEKCGGKGQSHHDDYSKPLEIRWLCTKHHGEQHRIYP